MTENQLILLVAVVLIVAGVAFAIYRNHKQKLHARQMTTRLSPSFRRPIEHLESR